MKQEIFSKLDFGEVICNKCHGFGKKPGTGLVCKKCHGDGKLDWVENIVGKRKKGIEFIFQDIDIKDFWPDPELMERLTKDLSEQIAKEVDREVMKQILRRERSYNIGG